MADVDPEAGGETSANRGQILVVAGLLLAVTFVGLALVLNSGIYAENLASRDTGGAAESALAQQQQLDEGFAAAADRTNANVSRTSDGTIEADLERALRNQSDIQAITAARSGSGLGVDSVEAVDGVRLRQTDETRNFTSKTGKKSWTLTDGVPEGGQFAMNVQRTSLFQATLDTTMSLLAESAFAIEFPTDTGVWRIYLFRGAATESVYAVVETDEQNFRGDGYDDRLELNHVVDGWLNQSCALEGDTVSMRLDESTFGGTHCEHFEFYQDIDAHSVRYNNTVFDGEDRARGTYDVLAGTTDVNEDGFYSVDEDGQPFYQSAIYAINYTHAYQTDDTEYVVENRTVLPREMDRGGILWEHPFVEAFDVTNATGGGTPEFDVEWRVSHEQGELDRVELELVEVSVEKGGDELEDDVDEAIDDPAFDDLLDGLGLTDYMDDYEDVIDTPVNANTVVDTENESVSGPEATGSTTLTDEDDLQGTHYRVQITAYDSSGRTHTRTKLCEAGDPDCEEVE